MYEIVKKIFEGENPKSIFEVGCAGGALLKDYDRKVKIGGLDINGDDIKKARQLIPKGKFIEWDATKPWPIANNSYDIVFTIGTLVLIENPLLVIQEMMRVAKDKIILAESQNEIERIEDTGGTRENYRYRFIRDYKKLLPNAIITYGDNSKSIIKCQKKIINLL